MDECSWYFLVSMYGPTSELFEESALWSWTCRTGEQGNCPDSTFDGRVPLSAFNLNIRELNLSGSYQPCKTSWTRMEKCSAPTRRRKIFAFHSVALHVHATARVLLDVQYAYITTQQYSSPVKSLYYAMYEIQHIATSDFVSLN